MATDNSERSTVPPTSKAITPEENDAAQQMLTLWWNDLKAPPVNHEEVFLAGWSCARAYYLQRRSPDETRAFQGLKSIGFEPRGSQTALVVCFDSIEHAQEARSRITPWIIGSPLKASGEPDAHS